MALNIFLTLLLIFRLLYMRHQLRTTIGPQYGRMYTSIATMVLESALPNALISFVFVVLYAIHNPAANILLPLQVQANVRYLLAILDIFDLVSNSRHYSASHLC